MIDTDRLAAMRSATDAALRYSRQQLAKAMAPGSIRRRDKLIEDNLEAFTADVAEYFRDLASRIGVNAQVEKAVTADWDPDDDVDWDGEQDSLREVLGGWYVKFGDAAYEEVGEQLGVDISFDAEQPGVKAVLDRLASQVKDITDSSREMLRETVAAAVEQGLSSDQLAAQIGELMGGWTDSRAHTVALTESATAYAVASVSGYRDSGLVDEVEILDGDECGWDGHDDPDLADGSTRTLDEYDETPISHPNCQRAAVPVVAR